HLLTCIHTQIIAYSNVSAHGYVVSEVPPVARVQLERVTRCPGCRFGESDAIVGGESGAQCDDDDAGRVISIEPAGRDFFGCGVRGQCEGVFRADLPVDWLLAEDALA